MKSLLIIAAFCAVFVGCNSQEKTADSTVLKTESKPAEITENSLYNLDGVWKDEKKRDVVLKDLVGKPRVITMFYSTCTFACPKTIGDMKAIQAGLTEAEQKNLSFMLFSFDPARDTPERLDTVAHDMDLKEHEWQLLTADESEVQELAAVTNIQYKDMKTGDFSHSNTILILDKNGEIVHRQEGIGSDPKASIAVLKKLIAEN
jgi:protein SCO1/2